MYLAKYLNMNLCLEQNTKSESIERRIKKYMLIKSTTSYPSHPADIYLPLSHKQIQTEPQQPDLM